MDRAEVRAFLEQRVLGQPEAIEQVVDLITVFKAGLQDPNKPLATLFFVGPTGVGKTELAKALAEFLFGSRERVIRFDMGEYGSGDAVAKLLGSGWSHERKGGELTTPRPRAAVLRRAARRDREGAPRRLRRAALGDRRGAAHRRARAARPTSGTRS